MVYNTSAISQSTQGLVHKYVHEAEEYVVKIRGQALKSNLVREIRFTQTARDLGVSVVGYIYTGGMRELSGFTMPCLRVIKPSYADPRRETGYFPSNSSNHSQTP